MWFGPTWNHITMDIYGSTFGATTYTSDLITDFNMCYRAQHTYLHQ